MAPRLSCPARSTRLRMLNAGHKLPLETFTQENLCICPLFCRRAALNKELAATQRKHLITNHRQLREPSTRLDGE